MKTTQIFTLLAICLLFFSTAQVMGDGINSFVGTWVNERANISKISIEINEGIASVRVWGLCEDGPCELSSENAYDRVNNSNSELMAMMKRGELEVRMRMRLLGDRMEVRMVSISNDGQKLVTQKFMSSYNRAVTLEETSVGLGSIVGQLEGPAVSTASHFEVILLDGEASRPLKRQMLNPKGGFQFKNLPDGAYQVKIESPGESGVLVSPARFEVQVKNGQTYTKRIRLE